MGSVEDHGGPGEGARPDPPRRTRPRRTRPRRTRPRRSRPRRIVLRLVFGTVAVVAAALTAWSFAIGPVAVGRILAHGTTTVWDHLEYPGRTFEASGRPEPWPRAPQAFVPPAVDVDGAPRELEPLLADTGTLAFVVIDGGALAYEWYAPDHGPAEASMVFSVSKSVLSLLVGAAIDDGIIGSADDPVTDYVPELRGAGFDAVTLEDLLRMDTGLDYVEDDNPFGIHVEFNYTDTLERDILALGLRDRRDGQFRYKSGDNAVLGLVLDRALGDTTITQYLSDRLWEPLGAQDGGTWSTDREGGLERTWCCLAVTARDLARLGQLVLDGGSRHGAPIVSPEWLEASFDSAYDDSAPGGPRWPAEYADSPLVGYGYQWWLTDAGARLALGKDGQYLYADPARDVVIVRLGEGQGDMSWLPVLDRVAAAAHVPAAAAG